MVLHNFYTVLAIQISESNKIGIEYLPLYTILK